MAIVIPPDEVFQTPPKPLGETQGAYTIPDFIDLTFTEREGMVSNYLNHPFSRKGLQYPEATEANNHIKKIVVAAIQSISHPSKTLFNFVRIADYTNRNHYLQRRFYCKFAREVWKLTYLFVRYLGVENELAYRCGRIVANLFQYEEGYRMRVEDIFSETSKEALLKPQRELKRLLKIYLPREKCSGEHIDNVNNKFSSVFKLLRLGLLIPKVKSAWKFALQEMEIKNLQLDEADSYWCNMNGDYDFGGKGIEQRFNQAIDTYNWHQINKFKQNVVNNRT